ncbi:MAG: ASKHA domain-containing protein [Clostridiales Family XIII bacterium]|jgi:uncharacterized 2Fe-2S/4Fe-4S cluster protein (DUF4445 family)|nr:ASKHA domain-containing protein [Clostridiales Family XIII bacterium]
MNADFTITFLLEDGRRLSGSAAAGEGLLAVARRLGVPIDAPCGGGGTCGKCRVTLTDGSLGGERGKHIAQDAYDAGQRLACQSEVCADATVSVPSSAYAYQNRIRVADFSSLAAQASFAALKDAVTQGEYAETPRYQAPALTLTEPTLDDPQADAERLLAAVQAALATGGTASESSAPVTITPTALRDLPLALRENDFQIHVLAAGGVAESSCIVYAVSHSPLRPLGLCVDIGTTTVSAALVDLATHEFLALASAGNAQIRYGADVIGRLFESAKPGGVERLRDAITTECLVPLVETLCTEAGATPPQIVRAAIAGNTTMEHLFLGVYGNHIRTEPYVPAFFAAPPLRGSDVGLGIHPDADVVLAPNIGSYVGGDITAGVFASGIAAKESFSLFIDLGTNGELVFGNRDFLMACACSAGPAFEGGEIRCGMRATDGAITSLTIDEATLAPDYEVIGVAGQKPVGICGSGLIDLISELFRCGVIGANGKFLREDARIRTDEWGLTRYVVCEADASGTGEEIYINDADIDNFIRAKASIFSAIRTMLGSMDMALDVVEDIYLAGGIGSGIGVEKAIGIGMLPDLPPERYHYIGNTSLAGAYGMLVSGAAAARVAEIAGGMTYIELSAFPGYMDEFIAACFLPHTDASLFTGGASA